MIEMNFAASVEYLYSLGNEVSAMKLGLENIRTLLAGLGKPCVNKHKIQIAGTNGKGSVCAFLDAICTTAGIKTGLFTSPHLVSITERIKINGVQISEANFASMASFVRDTSEWLVERGRLESVPTFFEQVTAIALVAFANAGVDLIILETGLGGRLDATTAANAEIVAITRIDYDHQEYLGDTIEEIAAEKAAIIHEGSRVVAAHQHPEVERIIVDRCRAFNIEPYWATKNVATASFDPDSPSPVVTAAFRTSRQLYPQVILSLLGKHQLENAAVAIGVAEILQDLKFPISERDIWKGLGSAQHPGRLEVDDGILFDGAHNPAGAKALREFLDEYVDFPITMIFGAMKGKDIAEIAAILLPKADKLVLTQPDNSRAMTAEQLLEHVPIDFDRANITTTQSVDEAINAAFRLTGDDGLILVTGSLYLVGEVKKILNN